MLNMLISLFSTCPASWYPDLHFARADEFVNLVVAVVLIIGIIRRMNQIVITIIGILYGIVSRVLYHEHGTARMELFA